MSNSKSNMSRRRFLETAAVAGLGWAATVPAGCEERQPPIAPRAKARAVPAAAKDAEGRDLFSVLARAHENPEMTEPFGWIDQNGNEVDLKALQRRLKGKYKTLSFGYEGCQLMCPPINDALADFGRRKPDAVSIVVNVNPVKDGLNQASRDKVIERLRAGEDKDGNGLKQEIIVLFPVRRNAAGKLVFAPKVLPEVQINAGVETDREETTRHGYYIMLYDGNDRLLRQESSLKVDMAEWEARAAAGKKQAER